MVWVVCGVGIVGAVASLVFSRKTWEEYGKNHLLLDSDQAAVEDARIGRRPSSSETPRFARCSKPATPAGAGADEPEDDVEAELARLTAPVIDAELRQEIRDLVMARNHRRARQGKPPLDVEAEIEREIAGLSGI